MILFRRDYSFFNKIKIIFSPFIQKNTTFINRIQSQNSSIAEWKLKWIKENMRFRTNIFTVKP